MNKNPTVNFSPDKPKPVKANPPNDPSKGILAVNGSSGIWYVDKDNQHLISDTEELPPGTYTVHASIEDAEGEKEGVRIEKGKTTTLFATLGKLKKSKSKKGGIKANPTFAVSPPVPASPALPPGLGYFKVNNSYLQSGGSCSVDAVNWRAIPTTMALTQSAGYTVYVKPPAGSPMYSSSPQTFPVTAGKTTTVTVTFN